MSVRRNAGAERGGRATEANPAPDRRHGRAGRLPENARGNSDGERDGGGNPFRDHAAGGSGSGRNGFSGRLGNPAQLVAEVGGGLPARVRVLRHAFANHAIERRWHKRLNLGERRRLLLEDRRDEAGLARRGECRLSGDRFVQHQPEGEDVATCIGGLAFKLLRGHVLEGAEDGVFPSERLRDRGCLVGGRHGSPGQAGESEIQQLHPAFRHQDIGGFQIAMHDAVGMGRVERVGRLHGVLERGPHRQRPAQGFPFDVFQHQVVRPDIEQGANMRMVQGGHGARLPFEAVGESLAGDLDGHIAV